MNEWIVTGIYSDVPSVIILPSCGKMRTLVKTTIGTDCAQSLPRQSREHAELRVNPVTGQQVLPKSMRKVRV